MSRSYYHNDQPVHTQNVVIAYSECGHCILRMWSLHTQNVVIASIVVVIMVLSFASELKRATTQQITVKHALKSSTTH